MLRAGRFNRLERWIAAALAALVLCAGLAAVSLAGARGDWRMAAAGAGALAIGVLFARAAWLGRPLGRASR